MATLDEWERRLRPDLASVDLVGELDLSPEEVQQIAVIIAVQVKAFSPLVAIKRMERSYPATFVAFTVFQGGLSYDRGDFWGGVCEAAGLPNDGNYTVAWGQAFERSVRRYGLCHEFAGLRYVGAILGQGGIPAQSLPDFFEYMLQPSVTKPEWAVLSTHELIYEWLYGSTQYHVDKPILRFLEYGGRVADDFVERCRELAREYATTGELPAATDIGLSASLVRHYEEWLDQPGHKRPTPAAGPRWRRPQILLDPWGIGVSMSFPEQQVPPTLSRSEMFWQIRSAGACQSIPVETRRVDLDLKTRAVSFPSQEPQAEYRVGFFREDRQGEPELLREWTCLCLDSRLPILAFDPDTAALIPNPRRLPARSLWLLCGPGVEIAGARKAGDVVEEQLPRLPYAWRAWQAWRVNLTGLSEFGLETPEGQLTVQVADVPAGSAAELAGDNCLDSLDDPVPLYVGPPPSVRIPNSLSSGSDAQPERWQLNLNHEWNADPPCTFSGRLGELTGSMTQTESGMVLTLSHPRLLGSTAIGQYRLRLQGPLGRVADLRFRVVPKLFLTGHEPLYLPDPNRGAPSVHILVETDPRSELQFLQRTPGLGLKALAGSEAGREYQVDVVPDQVDVPLRIVRWLRSGEAVFVPVRLQVRRLRWLCLLHISQMANPQWQNSATSLNLAELEQSKSPYLLVDLPVAHPVDMRLRFLDLNEALLAELHHPAANAASRLTRFDLREARDALRQSAAPAVKVDLVIANLEGRGNACFTLLTLHRSIHVEEVSLTPLYNEVQPRLELAWKPEIPVNWRFVQLRCQTRPWADPIGFSLPDDARGCFQIPLAAPLAPGAYLAEFTVRDPWLPTLDTGWPDPGAPNIAEVVVGSLAARLAELVQGPLHPEDSFACISEQALLWRALGNDGKAVECLQQCYEHLQTATPAQMMGLARVFAGQATAKAIRFKLYRTAQIEQMVEAYRSGKLSESLLRAYLADLPAFGQLAPQARELLLSVPDERIQIAAAQNLIEQGQSAGLAAAHAWLKQGWLSNQAFLELMALNPVLAAGYLGSTLSNEEFALLLQSADNAALKHAGAARLIANGHAQGVQLILYLFERDALAVGQAVQTLAADPIFSAAVLAKEPPGGPAEELLARLIDDYPAAVPFVRRGMWVRTRLGWAQVERIESAGTGMVPVILKHEMAGACRLHVSFDPGPDAIDAVIDLVANEILLPPAGSIYQCGKCQQYIASRYDKITGEHDRTVHEGRGPTFSRVTARVQPITTPLEFRLRLPWPGKA